jgi:hypothetical protein
MGPQLRRQYGRRREQLSDVSEDLRDAGPAVVPTLQ